MAIERVSPGVYKDTETGKTVNAKTSKEANNKLGSGKGGKKKKNQDVGIPEDEKKQQEIENITQTVDTILGKGKEFGQGLVDENLQGKFGQIDANRTKEMIDYLNSLKKTASTAYDFTPYEQQAISQLEAGLGGYMAPELQAQREMSMQQVNQDLMTQMRLQELANARNRVRGASAGAGQLALQETAQATRGNIERDLFAKNADEIQKRKLDFSDLVNKTEAARFGRRKDADTMYGGALTDAEATETTKQQFNIGQTQNEALAKTGLLLGGIGTYTGMFGGQQGSELANNYFDLALKQQEQYNKEMQKRLDILASNKTVAV